MATFYIAAPYHRMAEAKAAAYDLITNGHQVNARWLNQPKAPHPDHCYPEFDNPCAVQHGLCSTHSMDTTPETCGDTSCKGYPDCRCPDGATSNQAIAIRTRIAMDNLEDIKQSDCLLLFADHPTEPVTEGKYIEAGMAMAMNKPVYVIGNPATVFAATFTSVGNPTEAALTATRMDKRAYGRGYSNADG